MRARDIVPVVPRYSVGSRPGGGASSIPQLKQFVEDGGTLIAIGEAALVGSALDLPIRNHLTAIESDGTERPLTREMFYVPGSLLRMRVDNTTPLGYGFEPEVDVFFDQSPVFHLGGEHARRVAWFMGQAPLRSGWALGQSFLDGGVTAVDAQLGRGRVLLFGPEITFRAQSHGTFKFLFNAIYYGKAVASSRMP